PAGAARRRQVRDGDLGAALGHEPLVDRRDTGSGHVQSRRPVESAIPGEPEKQVRAVLMKRVEVALAVDTELLGRRDGERVALPIPQYRPGGALVRALREEGVRPAHDGHIEGAVRYRLGV